MQEKIIEILIYLISELRKDKPLGEIDTTILTKKGYTASEIGTAFNWLYEKIKSGEHTFSEISATSSHSYRMLHNAERLAIKPEAYGYLIQLREIELITDIDVEMIIDRIMLAGYTNVGIDEMRMFVTLILTENDDSYNTGSRIMLNNNDTVN